MFRHFIFSSLLWFLLGLSSASHGFAAEHLRNHNLSHHFNKSVDFKKHNDFVVYGLISTRDLEKAVKKMSPTGANRTLSFTDEVHKIRRQVRLDSIPAREEMKKALEMESVSPESQKAYMDSFEKLKQIEVRVANELNTLFSDLIKDLSYGDRKEIASIIRIPNKKEGKDKDSKSPEVSPEVSGDVGQKIFQQKEQQPPVPQAEDKITVPIQHS